MTLALVLLAFKFIQGFVQFSAEIVGMSETDTLLILVIFSGYENFVSLIGVAQGSPDRPRWMGDVDFAGLKLKLIGSIVALSGINLLGAFLNLKNWSPQDLGWMVGIHLTFVVTGVLFALSEKIGHKNGH